MVLAILAETTEPIFSFLMLRLVSSGMARGYPLADFLAAGFLAAFLAAALWTGGALALASALALGAGLAFLGAAGATVAVLCGSSICSSRSRSTVSMRARSLRRSRS